MTPEESREVRALCQLVQTGRAELHLVCCNGVCICAGARDMADRMRCLWVRDLDDQLARVLALANQP